MTKVSYDKETKILSIRIKDEKIADSDVQGTCIIDYDKSGEIINIDVTEIELEDIITSKISKK